MTELAPDSIDAFVREIATRTGIVVRDRDRAALAGKLGARVRKLGYANGRAYFDWLFAAPDDFDRRSSPRGGEWQAIVQCVSVIESYLFRDRGQFQLLREHILPQAIERRRQQARQSNGEPPRLRIWSAACATGEEPYSLAILVRELLTDLSDWDVRIVATDINEAALARARRGAYGDWSFRQVDPSVRAHYFRHRARANGDEWQIDPAIARLVSFHAFNLARSSYPDPALHLADLDLILCRNVFIYLNAETIRHILDRMVRSLHPDGYLLTAHAELQHQDTGAFQAHLCPQSAIYQPLGSRLPPPNALSSRASATAPLPIRPNPLAPRSPLPPLPPHPRPTSAPASAPSSARSPKPTSRASTPRSASSRSVPSRPADAVPAARTASSPISRPSQRLA